MARYPFTLQSCIYYQCTAPFPALYSGFQQIHQPGPPHALTLCKTEFFIDNLLVRIHFIIVMIRWTGLLPWEFEFPFPGSLTSTFLFTV